MNIMRNRVETRYPDGRVEIFDPLIRWHAMEGMLEIGLRGDYAIGAMWGWKIGDYSWYRTKWIQVGRLTLYVHFGMREPWNPRTGKSYGGRHA